MSEPLSSVEIEDVLSSIRRLVSEDLRPTGRDAREAEVEHSKLILTPALRVVQDVPELSEISGAQQVMALAGARVPARHDDWEPETGDADQGTGAAFATEHEWLDADTAEAQTIPPDSWGPDSDTAAEDAARIGVQGAAIFRHRGAPRATEDVPGWAQEPGEEFTDSDEDFAPVAASGASANIEPDPAWAASAEAEVKAELAQDDAADAGAPDASMAYEEEVLRELVRDIIRDELQGDLGGRITRNIRKLVRAEIARAMAAESLLG